MKENTTDNFEDKSLVLKDSFETQKRDLRLKDLSDVYGLLKFKHTLKSALLSVAQTEKQYIYKLSHEHYSFVIIGTCHILPLDTFPKAVQDILFNCKVLISECSGDDENEDELEQSDNAQNFNQINTFEWFEELPIMHQQVINYIISDAFLENYRSPNLLETILSGISPQILVATIDQLSMSKTKPIDSSIIEEFTNSNKDVLYLESWEENQNELLSLPFNKFNQEFIEDLECLMENGGILMKPGQIEVIKSYLSGTLKPEKDSFVQERNENWFSKLQAYLENYPSDMLVCVGASHILGQDSLLKSFKDNGWKIEQSDLLGNFLEVSEY